MERFRIALPGAVMARGMLHLWTMDSLACAARYYWLLSGFLCLPLCIGVTLSYVLDAFYACFTHFSVVWSLRVLLPRTAFIQCI